MRGLVVAGILASVSLLAASSGHVEAAGPRPVPAHTPAIAPALPRAVLNQYCVGCHNEKLRTEADRAIAIAFR